MKRLLFILLMLFLPSILATAAEGDDTIPMAPGILESVEDLNLELPERLPRDLVLPVERHWPERSGLSAPWPTDGWSFSTPEAQGMDSSILIRAFRYGITRGSKALVVTRNGYIVGEWYGPGWDETTPQHGFSVSKSFTGALVGMLVDDGLFTGANQQAAWFISQWRNHQYGPIRIRNLLSMDSGLRCTLFSEFMLFLSANQNDYAISLPVDHQPGAVWAYNNAACQAHSELILQATGAQPVQYARDRLWNVIGMWNATWDTDLSGNTLTYMGVNASAREFAKFGYLYLRRGYWEDQPLISEQWIDDSTLPSQPGNPFYGYLLWLNTSGLMWRDVPADAFAALGMNERKIYVVPSLDIVAVRLGDAEPSWSDNTFLGLTCGSVVP